ncbi:hypothetical protein [Rubrivirga marina]|uniref:Uncharacterized protein n=1 Tax=Rubrivirga marina TaxID=1196024 RepID=A0A271J0B2_9BACT|nr:hypothetical protein [Rubrivirga marina]PAP76936.1 hypothetical protein BSZ37_11085 [Rubrivirga marina]
MAAEPWLRRFLLAMAVTTYVAAAVELALVEHYEGWQQILPFVTIGLGVAAAAWAWASPRRSSIRSARWAGVLATVTALAGVYFHVEGNLGFAREVRPDSRGVELTWDALSGVNPLLAPGMIALAGLLAAAATYRHPALAGGR